MTTQSDPIRLDPEKYPALMFLSEVAEASRTPLATIRYYVQTGRLTTGKVGRRRVMKRADVEAFIQSGFEESA